MKRVLALPRSRIGRRGRRHVPSRQALQASSPAAGSGRGPGRASTSASCLTPTDFASRHRRRIRLIACLALIAFFCFIVVRGLWLALRNEDPFCRFAAAGLTLMFGVQSWINMAVNLRAIPPKA